MKGIALFAVLGAATAAIAFAVVAVQGEDGRAQAAAPAQATTVQATMRDDGITATPSSAPAGEISFVVSNAGSMDHEFVIIKTDLAVDALPVVGDQVDENAAGIQVIDEIEPFAPGAQQSISVNLESGAYVLICNLPGHYQMGMRTSFTVTEGAATATPTSTGTPTATPTVGATETATATVTATPTPTGTVGGATQPPATGGGSDGNSGLPLAAWAAIGAAAFLALGAAAVTLGRWPGQESGR